MKPTKEQTIHQTLHHNPPYQYLGDEVNTATPGPLRTSHAPSEDRPDAVGAEDLLPLVQDSGHGLFDWLANPDGHDFSFNIHHSPQRSAAHRECIRPNCLDICGTTS